MSKCISNALHLGMESMSAINGITLKANHDFFGLVRFEVKYITIYCDVMVSLVGQKGESLQHRRTEVTVALRQCVDHRLDARSKFTAIRVNFD